MYTAEVTIESYTLRELSEQILEDLLPVYQSAYHGSTMHEDLIEDTNTATPRCKLFVARSQGKAIGGRVIKIEEDKFLQTLFDHELVFGKRFAVHPEFRHHGVGKALLNAGKTYCFNELNIPAMFGQSNEIGAMAMYRREGAMFHKPTIHNYFPRNSNTEAEQHLSLIHISEPTRPY